jgi:hypothetical protein
MPVTRFLTDVPKLVACARQRNIPGVLGDMRRNETREVRGVLSAGICLLLHLPALSVLTSSAMLPTGIGAVRLELAIAKPLRSHVG